MWKVTESLNVTTGSAAAGAAAVRRAVPTNCSTDMRLRTLSCATSSTPALPKFSFPPVWSPCQCVLITNFTG